MRAWTRILAASALWRIVCVCTLLVCTHLQTAFDTSAELVRLTLPQGAWDSAWDTWAVPFVRWDTVYFVALAHPERGYVYENTLAFQPGIVFVLRRLGSIPALWGDTRWSATCAVVGGAFLANVATIVAPVLLYMLTRAQTHSRALAERAALLAVFAPASATALTAPTPEPFYSVLVLSGLCVLQRPCSLPRWCAALLFCLATCFRANGILLGAFLLWHAIHRPWIEQRQRTCITVCADVVSAAAGMIFISIPFFLHQRWAYERLCPGRPWCDMEPIPLVYSFVQAHYWDVGFFRYWTLAQVPNFVLAFPVLTLGAYGCWLATPCARRVVEQTLIPWRGSCPASDPAKRASTTIRSRPALRCELVYVYHTAVVLCILLFASHVQIALRMATPGGMPMVWWAAAMLCERGGPAWTKGVVLYLLCYSGVACVLYAGFYPPA